MNHSPVDAQKLEQATQFFERTAGVAYYAASLTVRTEEAAQEAARIALVRVFCALEGLSFSFSQAKIALFIVAEDVALSMLPKAERRRSPVFEWISSQEADARILRALGRLHPGDRTALLLAYTASLPPARFCVAMGMAPTKGEERLSRAREAYRNLFARSRMPESGRSEETLESALLHRANEHLAALEAISNADPVKFSPAFVQETIRDMVAADPIRPMRRRWHRKRRIPTEYIGVGMLLLSLSILFYMARRQEAMFSWPKPDAITRSVSESAALQGTASIEMPDEKLTPETTRQISVEKRYYAAYADRILFFDARRFQLFFAKSGALPQPVGTLENALLEHGDLEHIGEKDGTIYLAFADGRGGQMPSVGGNLEITEYWQEEWFEGQQDAPETLRKGIILQDTKYTFLSAPSEGSE